MAKINISTLSINQLAGIYNKISDTPIRRFFDKSTGAARVLKLLEKKNLIVSDTIVGDDVITVSDELFLISADVRIRSKSRKNTIYKDHEVIEINIPSVVDPVTGDITYINPKRAGTKAHARMQLLINNISMTVGEYLAACAELEGSNNLYKFRIDLTWDIEHGYITFPNGADF